MDITILTLSLVTFALTVWLFFGLRWFVASRGAKTQRIIGISPLVVRQPRRRFPVEDIRSLILTESTPGKVRLRRDLAEAAYRHWVVPTLDATAIAWISLDKLKDERLKDLILRHESRLKEIFRLHYDEDTGFFRSFLGEPPSIYSGFHYTQALGIFYTIMDNKQYNAFETVVDEYISDLMPQKNGMKSWEKALQFIGNSWTHDAKHDAWGFCERPGGPLGNITSGGGVLVHHRLAGTRANITDTVKDQKFSDHIQWFILEKCRRTIPQDTKTGLANFLCEKDPELPATRYGARTINILPRLGYAKQGGLIPIPNAMEFLRFLLACRNEGGFSRFLGEPVTPCTNHFGLDLFLLLLEEVNHNGDGNKYVGGILGRSVADYKKDLYLQGLAYLESHVQQGRSFGLDPEAPADVYSLRAAVESFLLLTEKYGEGVNDERRKEAVREYLKAEVWKHLDESTGLATGYRVTPGSSSSRFSARVTVSSAARA